MTTYHYLEKVEERRKRLGQSHVSSQALCSTGDGHQLHTRDYNKVTCPKCIEMLDTQAKIELCRILNKDTDKLWGKMITSVDFGKKS